jgi:predicted flap endonuclease-1-like 5' DNA nuclease
VAQFLTLLLAGIRIFQAYKKIKAWFQLDMIFNFIFGTLVGALIGLLLAPKSGEKLRAELIVLAQKGISTLANERQEQQMKQRNLEAGKKGIEVSPAMFEEAVGAETIPDDLTRIKGIGPKVGELLQANQIKTYEQLVNADINWINDLLDKSGYGNINPSTWHKQAELAKQAEWEQLDQLQREI